MIVKVLVELDLPAQTALDEDDLKELAGYVVNTVELDIQDEESLNDISDEKRRYLAKEISQVRAGAVIGL